jgi:hypothetical protein
MGQPACFSARDSDSQVIAPETPLAQVHVPEIQQVHGSFLGIRGCAQITDELEILREKTRLQHPHHGGQQLGVPIQTLPEHPFFILRSWAIEPLAKKQMELLDGHACMIPLLSSRSPRSR